MKSPVILFFASLLILSPCHAEEVERKVDGELGRKLVESIFKRLPPWIDEIDTLQEFIVYDIHGEREGMHDAYGVNPWTGDVWNLWGCKRVSNPAMRKMQAEIKKRFTPEELKQYHRLHLLRPVNVGLDPC